MNKTNPLDKSKLSEISYLPDNAFHICISACKKSLTLAFIVLCLVGETALSVDCQTGSATTELVDEIGCPPLGEERGGVFYCDHSCEREESAIDQYCEPANFGAFNCHGEDRPAFDVVWKGNCGWKPGQAPDGTQISSCECPASGVSQEEPAGPKIRAIFEGCDCPVA